jgi:hypothetical protein
MFVDGRYQSNIGTLRLHLDGPKFEDDSKISSDEGKDSDPFTPQQSPLALTQSIIFPFNAEVTRALSSRISTRAILVRHISLKNSLESIFVWLGIIFFKLGYIGCPRRMQGWPCYLSSHSRHISDLAPLKKLLTSRLLDTYAPEYL